MQIIFETSNFVCNYIRVQCSCLFRATNPLVLGVPNGMDKAEEFAHFPPNGDDWAGWDSTVAQTVTVFDVTMSCSEVGNLRIKLLKMAL